MPFCSSGVTQQKPNLQRYIVYGSGAAELIGLTPGLEWLQAVAVVLGLVAYDLNSLCASDPPGFVSMDGTDIFLLMSPVRLPGYGAALDKLQQNVNNLAWYQLCQCAAVATPAQPATPTKPADYPAVVPAANPGAVVCFGPFSEGYIDLSSGTAYTSITYTFPVGMSFLDLQVRGSQNFGTPHGAVTGKVIWKNGSGATLRTDTLTSGPISDPGTTFSHSNVFGLLPPVGAVTIVVTLQVTAGVVDRGGYTITGSCGAGTTGTQLGPCCGSDPAVLALINTVLAQVNLIQRQSSPFGYVYGANHVGLTGNNSFTVSGLIGVSVDLTTIPASYGRASGTPVEYFDLGFVTLGTTDGFAKSRRIDHDGTLFLPTSAGVYTSVAYTLAPGVVADIRELVREP